MRAAAVAWLAAGLLAGGCASYSGYSLVAGKSTAQEIEQTMGVPAQKLPGSGGETIWYYPRGPVGWHTYAVRVGPDGVLRGIEQRLTGENFGKIVPDKTTKQEVLELVGPPFDVSRLPLKPLEAWEYQYLDVAYKWLVWVHFSDDGIVREVLRLPHPESDPPWSGSDFP